MARVRATEMPVVVVPEHRPLGLQRLRLRPGGNLGGRRGLGSGGGRVGRVHCGRQDLAVEWVNGCPLHGLDMEYSVGVGVLQVNSNWPKALMIRTEQDGYYPFY